LLLLLLSLIIFFWQK